MMKAKFCLQCGHELECRVVCDVKRSACPSCDWVHFEDPKVATGCLIFDDDSKVLLVKRSIEPVGLWTFPGGYVDRFEDVIPAARREVAEETGATITITSLLDIYRGPESPVLVLVYLARLSPDSPKPSALHECDDLGFFSKDEVPWSELAFSITAQALRSGFEHTQVESAQTLSGSAVIIPRT